MFNKSFVLFMIGVLTVILVAGLVVGIVVSSNIASASSSDFLFDDKQEARHHIMFIINEEDQIYSDVFFDGIKQAESDYHIAAEIISISQKNYEREMLEAMDKALYADVDGVFVHCVGGDELNEKIDELWAAMIPVFLLNEDMAYSKRISFIGVNRYNIGITVGKALVESMEEVGQIAVIDQKQSQHADSMSDDTLLLGISDVFRDYDLMEIEMVTYIEQGTLSAETVATQMFKSNPDINGIFCTNGQSTLGIAQAIIDNNKVNDITLYGYGDEEELLEYIERGKIVSGTIVSDTYDMGYTTIRVFDEYMNQNHVSSYIMTGIENIHQDNLNYYRTYREVRLD